MKKFYIGNFCVTQQGGHCILQRPANVDGGSILPLPLLRGFRKLQWIRTKNVGMSGMFLLIVRASPIDTQIFVIDLSPSWHWHCPRTSSSVPDQVWIAPVRQKGKRIESEIDSSPALCVWSAVNLLPAPNLPCWRLEVVKLRQSDWIMAGSYV